MTASTPSSPPADQRAAIALHRFGLGGADRSLVGADARAWLLGQIGPADAQAGAELPSGDAAVALTRRLLTERRAQLARGPAASAPGLMADRPDSLAQLEARDVQARLAAAVRTTRPFAERLAVFWSNHFTVSVAKPTARGLVGAFERDAIRPHIAGRFETMLQAAVRHPAMLLYLDNHRSAGPNSRVARRSVREGIGQGVTGLNENLAREVLELHTLGVSRSAGSDAHGGPDAPEARGGGYAQADVTAFAALLTGWRPDAGQGAPTEGEFEANWHEPGPKTVLGTRYDEGPQALQRCLADLAARPETARFLATKLARHFVADDPPPGLVERLAAAYRGSGGALPAVYTALVDAPEAWSPQAAKLKTPEEFVVSSARLLGPAAALPERPADAGLSRMGQRVQGAPSPAGWSDRAEDWLGPEAVWQRIEWAARFSERAGSGVDARALARSSLGPMLSAASLRQIERAADGPQALALLLMSPEFQRR